MTDDLIARWADLLADYCLRVQAGESILIASEWDGRPLVEACYKAVVLRGAHPIVRLEPPGLHEFFVEQATEAQLNHLPPVSLYEVETFEVLGPGRVPFARMRYEFTWYVRDGIHVRSPVKVNGVPMSESERRAYEDRWVKSEEGRRKFRTEREAKREEAGKPPALSAPSINEPRFISESYFMDFKFEPGNYYLAGKETLDGQQVLKVDYVPIDDIHKEEDETDWCRLSISREYAIQRLDGRDFDHAGQGTHEDLRQSARSHAALDHRRLVDGEQPSASPSVMVGRCKVSPTARVSAQTRVLDRIMKVS